MTKKLSIGVVGAGKFGGYHAGKCDAHSKIDFRGVFDINETAANLVADRYSVSRFASFDAMIEACQAIIIAAPANFHADYAIKALSRGRHILIEKPLAVSVKDAERITELASKHNLVVQLGHQERFVGRAIGLDKITEKPILIKARRLSPFSERGTDTSVTMDLMTHDIDLANWLLGSSPTHITAYGVRRRTNLPDHVFAELEYGDRRVFLEASRLSENSHRSLEISYPSGTIIIDLNAKTLKHDTSFSLNEKFGSHPEAMDSLGAGTNEFVNAVLENRRSFIPGTAGLEAVRVAVALDGQI